MPTGSLVYHEPRAASTYFTLSNYTLGAKVHFDKTIALKSLFFKASTAVTLTAASTALIYKVSDQSVVASQAVTAQSLAAGQEWEVVFSTPPTLNAGEVYMLAGFFSTSQGYAFGLSNAATRVAVGTTYASTPAGVNMIYDAAGMFDSGGTSPTYPITAYTANDFLVGYSADYIPPVVSNLSPNNTTINNLTGTTFNWTYSSAAGSAQTKFEISYGKQGDSNWTTISVNGTGTSYTFPADTFEDASYIWNVRAYDGTTWSTYAKGQFTNQSWTNQTAQTSSAAAGVIDATAFTVGDYDVEVRVADASGVYGSWSTLQTFTLGPPSNVWVKSGGTWKQCLNNVRVAGTFKQAPPTKKNTGGTFN